MWSFFTRLFDTEGFPARWYCGTAWTNELGWLHIASDLATFAAYTAIPCVLAFFVLRRRDVPFPRIFWLFVAFIFFCGTVHLIEATIFWWPWYRLSGLFKAATAAVSLATVAALIPIAPRALRMRTPEQLEREVHARTEQLQTANRNLKNEVAKRKELEDELRRRMRSLEDAQEQLREADRRKNEFVAMLAHELRNPLAPLRSGLDLLQMPGVDPETAEWTKQTMQEQVTQMVRLIDDLLDISRIVRGKITLQPERVNLADVIQRAVNFVQPLVGEKRHELSVELPSEPVWVNADTARLAQVFSNLLNNAAKYTDVGGQISITAEHVDGEAVVRVCDNGAGIDEELRRSIFDLFVQADTSMARSQGGLGIGLTLVRHIVEMHGGRVDVHSDGPGGGSQFTVYLPAEGRATAPVDDGQTLTDRIDERIESPRRIVIVDDNDSAASMLALLLRHRGHEVQTAATAGEGADLIMRTKPDIAFLDIGLPDMTGFDLATQLRGQPDGDQMFLVALTGYGQDGDRRRATEVGFDIYMVKPPSEEDLRRILRHANLDV